MARIPRRNGRAIVALRTDGAVIVPKAIRDGLRLRPGDLLEVIVRDGDVMLHPRPMGRLALTGVPDERAAGMVGAVRLGVMR
jgi:AbrB family looped-hinge helix DNA binding protein